MRNMEVSRILHAAHSIPWAIIPEKLAEIRAFLYGRAQGIEVSAEEQEALRKHAEDRQRFKPQGSVAVIPVLGTISKRMNMMSAMSGGTSTELLAKQIQAAVADASISAIVLDVDSPGGTVDGIPELHAVMLQAREQKPVVASVNSLAASAAYWAASAATEIAMTPSGQTGSIGVLAMHRDLSGALEQEGIKVTLVSAGKYKTEGNPFEPLTEEGHATLQGSVDAYYSMFIRDIAKGRGISTKDVVPKFGEGRLVLAKDALAAGMVDKIETFDQTVGRLARGKTLQGKRAEGATPQPAADVKRKLDLLNL